LRGLKLNNISGELGYGHTYFSLLGVLRACSNAGYRKKVPRILGLVLYKRIGNSYHCYDDLVDYAA
jgi:hypothetical protein